MMYNPFAAISSGHGTYHVVRKVRALADGYSSTALAAALAEDPHQRIPVRSTARLVYDARAALDDGSRRSS